MFFSQESVMEDHQMRSVGVPKHQICKFLDPGRKHISEEAQRSLDESGCLDQYYNSNWIKVLFALTMLNFFFVVVCFGDSNHTYHTMLS